jgi:hypothetical protein
MIAKFAASFFYGRSPLWLRHKIPKKNTATHVWAYWDSGKELAKATLRGSVAGRYLLWATVNQHPPAQSEGWMISGRKQFSVGFQFPS